MRVLTIMRVALVLTVFLSGISIISPQCVAAQGQIDPIEMEAFFDEFLTSAMAEHHVPGAAIVVVKNSEIMFAKGYGYANLENQIPVDPETTIFRWASVSKLFPIAGVLRLVAQGKMDLDADVNQYLRDWQVPNDFSTPIRVRDLLQHTDGFGSADFDVYASGIDDLEPMGTYLARNVKSPVQEPGNLIAYGSDGTSLAGHLLEQISGSRFEDHIAVSFFEPLGMHYSTFYQVLPPEYQENIAPIYSYEEDTDVFVPSQFLLLNTPPSGGLSASPLDMAYFVIALLNDGRFEGAQVLSPTSAQAMLEQQYEPSPGFPGVTFGFFEHFYGDQRGLIRDGSGLRTRAQVYLLPEHSLGYIYVQNTSGDDVIDELNELFIDTFYPAPENPLVATPTNENSHLSGFYRLVQTNEHTFVKSESLILGELRVEVNPDSSLTITPLGFGDVYGGFEGSHQWVEIAPQVFRRIDRERYVAFVQDENSQNTYLFSGSGYHGAYYRLPWYEASNIQFLWMGMCLFVIVSGLVIWPFGLLSGGRGRSLPAKLARWVGSGTSLLVLIGFFGSFFALFIKQIAAHPSLAFGMSPLALAMQGALLLGAILGLATPVFAVLAWKESYWSVWGRIHYTALAAATLAFIWWLNYWNLVGFRY
jgi:CubicO group peptidase (beta-lactamase class C family)